MKSNEFKRLFETIYDDLYEQRITLSGEYDVITKGDQFIQEHKEFMQELYFVRQDVVSSDREVLALMLSLRAFEESEPKLENTYSVWLKNGKYPINGSWKNKAEARAAVKDELALWNSKLKIDRIEKIA